MAHPAPSTCRLGQPDLDIVKMSEDRTLRCAADFRPDMEALGPGSSVLGGSDVIAAEMEEVVDLIVG